MLLVLGRGNSGEGMHLYLTKKRIKHDYLNSDEVKKIDYKIIIKSPGIRYDNRIICEAILKGIKVISDIELINILERLEMIAVTGTNGKTTVMHLLGLGLKYPMCGNIGFSIGEAALLGKSLLVEASSFQLAGTTHFKPKIAIILNVSRAHIDYHKTFYEYVKAKENITANQDEHDYLVTNYDDNILKNIITKAKKVFFSLNNCEADCYYKENFIYYKGKKQFKITFKTNPINYLAAFIVLKLKGKSRRKIKRAFYTYQGIPFRIEQIAPGIYNDAKSTNPASTINAIRLINRPLCLIAGGKYRNEDLSVLEPYINKIKKAFVYGETKDLLENFFCQNSINICKKETLKEVTMEALKEEGIILYSPMFASYDQFQSYEERGLLFTSLVNNRKPRYFH